MLRARRAGSNRLKIYFDGSARPNPGTIRTAVVARGRTYHRDHAGCGDNNDAEWLALIDALGVAKSLEAADVLLLGDSALVVGQANGAAPCRSTRLRDHYARYAALAAGFDRLRIKRIRRTQNLAGIALDRMHAECRG